jgi:hypothetical protein
VVAVTEVLDANGDTVDPSNYRLVEHSTLVFDPGFTWDSHDITVTYDYGTMPPQLGRMAARQLAIEFCHLWAGEECAFPERVTSVSRLGVSFTILDNQDFIDDMRTGVYAVDLFLKSVNPDRARARARVFSVDIPRAKRQPN